MFNVVSREILCSCEVSCFENNAVMYLMAQLGLREKFKNAVIMRMLHDDLISHDPCTSLCN